MSRNGALLAGNNERRGGDGHRCRHGNGAVTRPGGRRKQKKSGENGCGEERGRKISRVSG